MNNKTSDKNVANIEELIQEYKTYNDLDGIQDLSIYINALENILAEREQKDKRIKELEEESRKKSIELICYQEELENSIPTQVVIDKIEELKLSGGSNGTDNVENLVRELTIEILQKLLEGEE